MSDKLANKLNKAIHQYMKPFRKDEKDLLEVEGLLREGEYVEAYKKAESLDTFVREEIPVKVWDKMEDEYNKVWETKEAKKIKKAKKQK